MNEEWNITFLQNSPIDISASFLLVKAPVKTPFECIFHLIWILSLENKENYTKKRVRYIHI